MPIYEYKCPNGHLFEAFHGMTEAGPSMCEVCGAGPLQIVLHPVAVHYKGSGFYSTDYGRKSKHGAVKDGSSSDGSSSTEGGGSGGSGESGGSGSGGSGESGGSGGSGESGGETKKAAEA